MDHQPPAAREGGNDCLSRCRIYIMFEPMGPKRFAIFHISTLFFRFPRSDGHQGFLKVGSPMIPGCKWHRALLFYRVGRGMLRFKLMDDDSCFLHIAGGWHLHVWHSGGQSIRGHLGLRCWGRKTECGNSGDNQSLMRCLGDGRGTTEVMAVFINVRNSVPGWFNTSCVCGSVTQSWPIKLKSIKEEKKDCDNVACYSLVTIIKLAFGKQIWLSINALWEIGQSKQL